MPPARIHADLQRARSALLEAELTPRAADRYLAGHHAALRIAALILAGRSDPTGRGQRAGQRARPRNTWALVATVAPELAEWAAYFAATEGKRDAVRAGATTIVTAREADDLVRDAHQLLSLVERSVAPVDGQEAL